MTLSELIFTYFIISCPDTKHKDGQRNKGDAHKVNVDNNAFWWQWRPVQDRFKGTLQYNTLQYNFIVPAWEIPLAVLLTCKKNW